MDHPLTVGISGGIRSVKWMMAKESIPTILRVALAIPVCIVSLLYTCITALIVAALLAVVGYYLFFFSVLLIALVKVLAETYIPQL